MRKIIVQIVSNVVDKASSPSADAGGGSGGNDESQPKADTTDKKKINATAGFAYQISRTVTSQVVSQANYYVGKYYSMTEDYKGQQNSQNTMKAISLVTGTASSAVSLGVLGGTAFGPVGAIVGATLGVAMSAVTNYMNAKNEYNEAMLAIHENAYSNYFYSERAGYADGGRGTND